LATGEGNVGVDDITGSNGIVDEVPHPPLIYRLLGGRRRRRREGGREVG